MTERPSIQAGETSDARGPSPRQALRCPACDRRLLDYQHAMQQGTFTLYLICQRCGVHAVMTFTA